MVCCTTILFTAIVPMSTVLALETEHKISTETAGIIKSFEDEKGWKEASEDDNQQEDDRSGEENNQENNNDNQLSEDRVEQELNQEDIDEDSNSLLEGDMEPALLNIASENSIVLRDVSFTDRTGGITDVTPLESDSSVFICSDNGFSKGYRSGIIKGYFDSDSKITIDLKHPLYDENSGIWDITKQPSANNGEFEIKFSSDTKKEKKGAIVLRLSAISEDGDKEEYTLILYKSFNYDSYVSKVSIFDDENLVDLNLDMQKSNTKPENLLRIFKSTDVPSVVVKVNTPEALRGEKSAGKATFRWMQADMNYISVNGSPLVQFDSPNGGNEEVYSPSINFKKGLNVVSVFRLGDPLALDKAGQQFGESLRGFAYNDSEAYLEFTYIIFYDGAELEETPPSDDAGLSDVKVFQYVPQNSPTPRSVYPIQVNSGGTEHTVALPEQMPSISDSVYMNNSNQGEGIEHHTIVLKIKTADPYAKAEIIDTGITGKDGDTIFNKSTNETISSISMIDGNSYGALDGKAHSDFYFPINVWNKDEIKVKVTAQNGEEETHTIDITRASGDANITSLTVNNGTLATETSAIEFSPEIYSYYLDVTSSGVEPSFNIKLPEGAKLSLNGQVQASGSITLNKADAIQKLIVTAADGVSKQTYVFVTRIDGNRIPLFEVNAATVDYANGMLDGWNERTEEEKKDLTSAYWDLYKTIATLDSNITSQKDVLKTLEGSSVYDVTKHNYRQATDYAAVILQLVMLGENPYNYKGKDYVALLMKENNAGNFGAFGNNIWALMALKAAGAEIPEQLLTTVKNQAKSERFDLDMRGWALAAISDYINPLERAQIASSIADTQVSSGEESAMFKHPSYNDINTMTHACVLSGIAGAGIDAQSNLFIKDGRGPLEALKEEYSAPGGQFYYSRAGFPSYSKDIIIALGDIVHGSNVWQRYTLTEVKKTSLLSEAQGMLTGSAGTEAQKSTLSEVIQAAQTKYDGEAYYSIYEAMAAIDPSMKASATVGSPLDMFNEMVQNLSDVITISDKTLVEEVMNQYEALTENYKGNVNVESMNKFRNSQGQIIGLEAGENAKVVFEEILNLPEALIITLNHKPQVDAARVAYNALTSEEQASIIWAGASVLGRLTEAEEMIKKLSNPSGPIVDTITVNLRLLGVPKHDGSEPIYIYSKNPSKFENWIPEKTYTFNASSVSVYQVFTRAINEAGLAQNGAEDNYVSSIKGPNGTWLAEFDNGKNSGWMYTVNGIHPSVGLQDYYVSNGDNIVWHYTDDFTQEEGSEKWNSGGQGGSGADQTVTPETTIKDGKGTTTLDLTAMKDVIANAKTNNTDIIIEPKTTGDVKAMDVTLKNDALQSIIKETTADVIVKTPVGDITIPAQALEAIAAQAGGNDITIQVEHRDTATLTQAQKDTVGDNPVYDISILSGGKHISSFDGKSITISLPYTLKDGENADGVQVWYLNDKNELENMKASYDAKTGLATFTTNHLSKFVVGYDEGAAITDEWQNPFTDVKKADWFYNAVAFTVERGIFGGMTETTFAPNTPMTRAMLVTVLHRMEGAPTAENAASFKDVAANAWYAESIAWANENSIVAGLSKDNFGPNDPVTREQLAAILNNYADFKGQDITARADLSSYADRAQISSWAKEAVAWANAEGLLTGRTATTIAPKGQATRAEVAAILQRYVEGQ